MRLTRLLTDKEIELANDYSTREETKRKKGDYTILDNVKPFDAVNKLGKYEDIEEELGIGLDVLYELLVRGCYYKCDNEILYTFGNVDVSNKCICNPYNKEVLFKDYGKIWALTKEELE